VIYVEYFSDDMLVEHTLRPKGKRTTCGDKVSKTLPARPIDLAACGKGESVYAKCFECTTGIDLSKENA